MSANGKHSMNYDAGFPLSDHADWNGLLSAIDLTDAENIITMHGFADTLAAHLRSIGKNAVSWD
jgi:putative mRNA 3-end processing factor